jgi:hypothetical protein
MKQPALNRWQLRRSAGGTQADDAQLAGGAASRPAGTLGVRVLLLMSSLVLACGNHEEKVSYSRDIKPLFALRCVPCHNSAAQGGRRDLEDPFTLDEDSPGMFVATNDWDDGPHAGQTPEYNVVPYHPEESFLLEKISNPHLLLDGYDPVRCTALAQDRSVPLPPECRALDAGAFMPAQQSFPEENLKLIRDWISAGADEAGFNAQITTASGSTTSVAALFGDPSTYLASPCGYCHYPGGPETPSFTEAFDPVVGIVNVSAHYRGDLKLVDPGNPDDSFLIMKLEATGPGSATGAPMPRNYEALDADQVALITRWIAEGAKNN